MILVGDVGGTKANIGLVDFDSRGGGSLDNPVLINKRTYSSPAYSGLESIVGEFLAGLGKSQADRIETACFGIAGPISGNVVRTPNLPWVVDGKVLAEQFRFTDVKLLNDLVATAEGIPALGASELLTLQAGSPPSQLQSGALIAAGTGLGMALLIASDGGWIPTASEGGHADFAPPTAADIDLVAYLHGKFPEHVSKERVVSGSGLYELYQYVLSTESLPPDVKVQKQIEFDEMQTPRIISERALAGECPICIRALDLFIHLYGAVAGDLALTTMARSGLYIGGGIAPKILPKLRGGQFLEAFCAKGRFRGLMEKIPVHVIVNPETAMLGAARHALRRMTLHRAPTGRP